MLVAVLESRACPASSCLLCRKVQSMLNCGAARLQEPKCCLGGGGIARQHLGSCSVLLAIEFLPWTGLLLYNRCAFSRTQLCLATTTFDYQTFKVALCEVLCPLHDAAAATVSPYASVCMACSPSICMKCMSVYGFCSQVTSYPDKWKLLHACLNVGSKHRIF